MAGFAAAECSHQAPGQRQPDTAQIRRQAHRTAVGGLPVRRYGPCEPDALRDRMLRAVASLGEAEVRSIIEEQGKVEVSDILSFLKFLLENMLFL